MSGLEPSGLEPGALEPGALEPSGLARFRDELDALDEQLVRLFARRFDICREIAAYKSEHEIPMMQSGRVEQVRRRYLLRGAELGIPAAFSARFVELMIGATCALEDELMAADAADALPSPPGAAA